MTKDVAILILGLLTAAMPFLGFPTNYENIIFVALGLTIAILAFIIRGDTSLFNISRSGDTFAEHQPEKRKQVNDGIVTEGTDMNYEEESVEKQS